MFQMEISEYNLTNRKNKDEAAHDRMIKTQTKNSAQRKIDLNSLTGSKHWLKT